MKTFAVEVGSKFQLLIDAPPGTWSWSAVIGEDPVLLIVMLTSPPLFQLLERAKEVPALHVLAEPLEGVGLVPVFEEAEVLVEVEGAALEEDELEELEEDEDEDDDDELDEEEELEELGEGVEDPALQLPWVAHWQVAASEQEGEPPPPQGTWR